MSGERRVNEPDAWILPTLSDLPVKAEALARALAREEQGASRNRAYFRCRRWHRKYRGEMFTANGRVCMDCTRCGMRWMW